jgi:hypothetical protein
VACSYFETKKIRFAIKQIGHNENGEQCLWHRPPQKLCFLIALLLYANQAKLSTTF